MTQIIDDVLTKTQFNNYLGTMINVKYPPVGYTAAKGDGTTDDTTAIQTLLDNFKNVFVPKGDYRVSQLVVPDGVKFYGEGIGGLGNTDPNYYSSQIRQLPNVNKDMIIFEAHFYGERYWIGPVQISSLVLMGDSTNTSGNGIAFKTATHNATVQDVTTIKELVIRNFAENGMLFTDGALPCHIRDLNILYNGGYGISYTATLNLTQAVHFDNISGDANVNGLFYLNGVDNRGSMLFTNTKSESNINNLRGNVEAQKNVFVIENCDKANLHIDSVTHICAIPDGSNFKKPGDVIKLITTGTPTIRFNNIAVRLRPGDTGTDPLLINDIVNTKTVSLSVILGIYGKAYTTGMASADTTAFKQFLGGTDYQSINVENPGFQIQGVTPGLGLYESDAAANEKKWLISANGGDLFLRTVNDDGTTGNVFMVIYRTGAAIDYVLLGNELQVNSYIKPGNVTSLQTAANAYRGKIIRVEGGLGVADGTYICRKTSADVYKWVNITP